MGGGKWPGNEAKTNLILLNHAMYFYDTYNKSAIYSKSLLNRLRGSIYHKGTFY